MLSFKNAVKGISAFFNLLTFNFRNAEITRHNRILLSTTCSFFEMVLKKSRISKYLLTEPIG